MEFSEGAILAYTESQIYPENHVTVMFGFSKGVLTPTRKEEESFETVKQTALDGSSYDSSGAEAEDVTTFEMLLGVVILIGTPIAIVVFFWGRSKKRRQKKLRQFAEQHGYFRDIPNGNNASATYVLGKQFEVCEEGAILSMGMLKLIELGCLSPITVEEIEFMGRSRETVNLQMINSRHGKMNEYDEYFYTVLEGAAGTDGVLQAKELERFAESNDTLIRNYINKCDSAGKKYLQQKHCLKQWNNPSKLKDLTPSGEKELEELLGFQKYLEDFSLIAERGIKEIPIWRELLSYAMLFGMADKLAEQMRELYPNIAVEVTTYNKSLSTAYSYQHLMYRNMRQAEQSARDSGGGGFSSLGGGGGSIGGGSGGGTR